MKTDKNIFRIGLVGLCTTHPRKWTKVLRDISAESDLKVEVVAAWDSGEVKPAGFAKEFCKDHNVANCIEKLEDMLDLVDGVIVHTTNWDKHLEQAKIFIDAGKSVLIDKPIVGRMSDVNTLLEWMKQGKIITGGSSLRFNYEVMELLAQPISERGNIHTAYCCVGMDEFNYGIHGYALLSGLMGPGIRSVKYVGSSQQKQLRLSWHNGNIAFLTIGKANPLPFNVTAISNKKVFQILPAPAKLYRNFLENVLPYFTGQDDTLPYAPEVMLEPELAALAGKQSWLNNGQEIFLTDLGLDSATYDGTQFANEYRLQSIGK
jgi:Oxidoreductase family, NAD-binding Rossmann fold